MFMNHEGETVFVRGYGAVFNRPSVPLERNGWRAEIIKKGAFDGILKAPPTKLSAVIHHVEGAGDLKLWTDGYGLAFQAGPLEATRENASVIRAIVCNETRGCSWLGTPEYSGVEVINGETVRIIRSFSELDHIGPVVVGAFPAACCWCSHEDPFDLPLPMQPIVAHWQENRTAVRPKMAASAASISRRRENSTPPPPMSDAEWACPPTGFSLDAWLSFGRACGHGAREMNRFGRRRPR